MTLWQDTAACATADPTLFDATTWTDRRTPQALALCATCHHTADCYRLLQPDTTSYDGIAAGMVWRNGHRVLPPPPKRRPTRTPTPPTTTRNREQLAQNTRAEAQALNTPRRPPRTQSALLAWAYPALDKLLAERYPAPPATP